MMRPCTCENVVPGPYTAGQCRVCWLYHHDPRYRRLWAGERTDTPPAPPAPCAHLGGPTGATRTCSSCRGHVAVKLLACAVHGACTALKPLAGVACCGGCPDYRAVPRAPDPFPVRHLLYFVWPVAGNGTWQRNVLQLRQRLRLFTGKRLVAVATGPGTDRLEDVRAAFAGERIDEWLVYRNDPRRRECIAFHDLWGRLETASPREVVFTAHAKGVTKPVNAGVSVHPWTELLYQANLDYWPLVEEALAARPLAGAFKKVGHGFSGSRSGWHFSGTFFWARCADVFARDWRRLDPVWWGTESWPGVHFAAAEAACLFHEGTVPQLNLYALDYLNGTVLPAWREWRRTHAARRTPP